MAFADEIRVEIENYSKLYDTYKNTDFSEQLKILDKALKMEEERYRSDVLPLHTQIKAVEKALSGLKKFKSTTDKISKLINRGLDGGTLDDATIKAEYSKLQSIRQDIMAALPKEIPAGVDELDYAKKYLTQRQAELLYEMNLRGKDMSVGRRMSVASRKEETEIINAVQRPERNGRPNIRLGMLAVKPCICAGSAQTIAMGARAA